MARRCCCVEGCIILQDDFDRDNSTDLGSQWTEVSGDWEIDTDQLVEAGTTNARIVTTAKNTSGRGYVDVKIYPNSGDKFRILLNSDSTATAYQYVEAHCTTASLILTAGGETRTYTAADGWNINELPIMMSGCVTDGCLYVQVSHLGFDGCVWDNTVTVSDSRRHAGLMNGGSSELTWDDFIYRQHEQDDPDCPDCTCFCTYYDDEGHPQRYYPHWKLKIDWYSEFCLYDGTCADLEYDCSEAVWFGVSGFIGTTPVPQGSGPGTTPKVVCGEDDRCSWTLTLPGGECCDGNNAASGCPTGPDGCSDIGAEAFVCGNSSTFAVRWDIETIGDLSCPPNCGVDPMDSGGWYGIMTEGSC